MIPRILYQFKEYSGTPFCPSNGTEMMIFVDNFCSCCIHEKWMHTQKEEDKKCDILNNMMIFKIGEDGYPVELVYDSMGWPICTNWKKWDWGDSDDFNEPPEEPYTPDDPNQLMLFSIADDILTNHKTKQNEKEVLQVQG